MKELKNRDIPYKIYLSEDEMPRYWYNVRADMKNKPAPLLNPGTLQPMTAEEMGQGGRECISCFHHLFGGEKS